MISLKYFLKKIQDVSLRDYLQIPAMLLGWFLSPFFKGKYKDVWLVCEKDLEARDNGYHFFKYMCTRQPQQPCVYAISRKATDAAKVSALGPTVDYGSVKHWILYFTTRYNISSMKGGKPNAALCSFFELNNIFKPHNIFLQHGITINRLDWLMASKCRFDLFITTTASEDAFVRRAFGYPPDVIRFTGFPRFDNLHDPHVVPRRILIMPTWRKWLRVRSERNEALDSSVASSEYRAKWMELLDSPELARLMDEHGLEVIFYPHRNMQPCLSAFEPVNKRVIIASMEKYDVQELMKSSALMITDYSSVFFDMIYMKKPIIFYQFDEEKFRKYHYEEGWFDYHDNPFGTPYRDYRDVLRELERCIQLGFAVSEAYLEGHRREFPLYDTRNSERVFEILDGER